MQKRFAEMERWYLGGSDLHPSLARIRNFFIWKFGAACSECNWIGKNPFSGHWVIELDHISGDRSDSYPKNFRLLCPNCHAMTATYKGLNHKASKETFGVFRPVIDPLEL